jgi:hypothetical protein
VAASALGDPLGLVIGLDGNLLVSDGQTNQVKRYDSGTGAFIDVLTRLCPAATIHQGVLYVTNSNPPQGVQKFDATTGVNTGNFVPSLRCVLHPAPLTSRKRRSPQDLNRPPSRTTAPVCHQCWLVLTAISHEANACEAK